MEKKALTEEYFKESKNKTPRNWEEVGFLLENDLMQLVGREESVTQEYEKHQKVLAKEWKSINDYILSKCFGVETHIEHNLKCVVVSDDLQKTALTKNDYPYYLDQGLSHFVLWSLQPLTTQQVEDCLSREKHTLFNGASNGQFKWRRHGDQFRSVKGVWHVQVFCRAL